MELVILGALNWRVRSITPFPFLNFFISLAEIKEQSVKRALKERASEIIFSAHLNGTSYIQTCNCNFILSFNSNKQKLSCVFFMLWLQTLSF